jgi:hypothetical protein
MMTIIKDALELRPADKLFDNSPDAGHPQCICSRCGERIQEGEFPIRMFTTNGIGEVDEHSKEARYCEFCMTGEKYFYCSGDMEYGYKCKKQCEECKEFKNPF